MISPRQKKAFADFSTRWSRSLITLAGLVIGISAVIGVTSSFVILSNDLTENYTRTNPHNVVARIDGVTASQIENLAGIPGADEVEERRMVTARVELLEGLWFTTVLFVVENFNDMRIDLIDPEAGAWPAADGEVLIERDGRFFLRADLGTDLRFRFADGQIRTLKYVGTVHDAGQAPSRMERSLYGYITRATYDAWNLEDQSSRVLLTVTHAAAPQEESSGISMHAAPPAESRADYVANHLFPVMEYYGNELISVNVNDVTKHPHAFQMDSILGLLIGLLTAALLLCGALTINLIDSILTAEVRNIGVMKAIGGRRGQILRSYLLGMGVLSALAALIGLSFALDFGRGTAQLVARLINFDLLTETNPIWLAPSMVLLGMSVPLVLTWWRVDRAIRKPVRVALQNDEHLQTGKAQYRIAQRLGWVPLVPRMALRNLFRSPRRTVLTVLMVVVGLVSYLMAANIRTSLLDTVDAVQRSQLSDVQAIMRDPVNPGDMSDWLTQFNEIQAVEYWNVRSSRLFPVGDSIGRGQNVKFVPDITQMLVPDMMAGDWVSRDRPSGIVVSSMIYLGSDDVKIGSVLDFEVNGQRTAVTVVGVIKEFGGGAIYAPQALAEEFGIANESANMILTQLRDGSIETQGRFRRTLETEMIEDNWNVLAVRTTNDLEAVVRGHLDIIALVLEVVAGVMLVVCGLGLASSTSVSVMERTREIGVLKAIGGGAGAIRGVFLWESVFTALIGLCIALALAPISSQFISTNFGMVLVQYPFNYKAAAYGPPVAAAIAFGIALLASFIPAQAASRMSVHAAIQSV